MLESIYTDAAVESTMPIGSRGEKWPSDVIANAPRVSDH